MEDVESSIPARFEKIVALYPERLAIKEDSQRISYAQLNSKANRVAREVQAHHPSDTEPVAILLPRGIEQIAAMIAVLKAGRFFLTVEPSLPTARIEWLLDHSRTNLVITDSHTAASTDALRCGKLPVIDLKSTEGKKPGNNLSSRIEPDAFACLVHTSGSTGEPKGTICTHATLLHNTMLRTNADGLCPYDRIAHFTSGTSNAITTTLYALLNGAALLLFDINKDGTRRLGRWLDVERVSVCMIAAPVFRTLCDDLAEDARFPHLRLLRLRSDTVCQSDVGLYKRYFADHAVLANGLSSTEADMLSTYYIDRDTQLSGDDVPIGYTVQDKEILLIDDRGELAGVHEIGEIVVRSKYLSPGYWHNPELTAAKFKADPESPAIRYYYTGDFGLRLADGCLVHRGRKDFRVKIRGFGVEIGEVESALRDLHEVQDAVVVTKTTSDGTQLVAYLASQARLRPSISRIRNWLKNKLPDYMIPSTIIMLDALPLTSNGRIDRSALPEPGRLRPDLDIPYAAPRTESESRLTSIWGEVLSLDQIGTRDNFFELGGHSLGASRLISRVIRDFKLDLPLRALFDSPTIAQMAEVIDQHKEKQIDNEAMNRLLVEIESMSEAEAEGLMDDRANPKQ